MRTDAIIVLPGGRAGDLSCRARQPKEHVQNTSACPRFLFEIRLPLPAGFRSCTASPGLLLSFAHRVALYLLDASLASEQGFAHVREH